VVADIRFATGRGLGALEDYVLAVLMHRLMVRMMTVPENGGLREAVDLLSRAARAVRRGNRRERRAGRI
jgi:hypothetical protein